jgi:FMN reductase [NAD(P)H]
MKNNKMPSHHGVKEQRNERYPNQTLKILIERASLRNFSDKKIPPRILQFILESGIHAPTGGNLQPYSIIKIEKPATKKKLAKLCYQGFIAKAPVNLIFCIDLHRLERWAKLEVAPFTAASAFRHFWISFQDTMICAQNICTAADSLGLGSVYIGTVMEFFLKIKRMLKLPKGVFPVVLLCLGYPKKPPLPRKKLGVDIMVHNEKYRELSDKKLMSAFNEKYPGLKVEITEDRVKTIERVCRDVAGEKFAKKCIERIKKQGYISPVQRYFGLHYVANMMPKDNEGFLKIMERFGFNWFKKYRRLKDKKV